MGIGILHLGGQKMYDRGPRATNPIWGEHKWTKTCETTGCTLMPAPETPVILQVGVEGDLFAAHAWTSEGKAPVYVLSGTAEDPMVKLTEAMNNGEVPWEDITPIHDTEAPKDEKPPEDHDRQMRESFKEGWIRGAGEALWLALHNFS